MFDCHSHTPAPHAVYNLNRDELLLTAYPDSQQRLSAGIHPWWITPDWQPLFLRVQQWATHPQVVYIGETGLDRLQDTPLDLQLQVFRAHILLAEQVQKPLLIHCVKAQEQLLALRRELRPVQPWILHGFRGKPQQMRQLVQAGLYLSFGPLFHPQSWQQCPPERRLVETDDSGLSLQEVMQRLG